MATEEKGKDMDDHDGAVADESGLDAISEAVREGHVEDVLAFLESGGNPNISSPKTGRSLLHIACRQVIVDQVIYLDVSLVRVYCCT